MVFYLVKKKLQTVAQKNNVQNVIIVSFEIFLYIKRVLFLSNL